MRDVCLVVPCYNEERRLHGETFADFVRSRADVSLAFVNDGSADGTERRLMELSREDGNRLLVRSLARNSGKAEAVRQGVLHAASLNRFAFIGYWDADLSTPLTELDRLLAAFDRHPECSMVLGSRVKRLGSSIERNATRHYLGRVFSTMASRLLDLPVYDSQCGAKLFRAAVAAALFADPFVTRWVFDVELLVRLRNHLGREKFLTGAIEVPLTEWREVGGSKLSLVQMARMPLELLSIRSRYVR
jgi:glycosyltransferase involved in cell wall biosynthesis